MNLRLLIWLGVLLFFVEDRCLYFMSYLVSYSSSLFLAYCFLVLVLVCSFELSFEIVYLYFFQSSLLPRTFSYFSRRFLCFYSSSSFIAFRNLSWEFSIFRRSIIDLSSFISLKYIILTRDVAPNGSSLSSLAFSSMVLTVTSLL
jgi:hypothetical protein